MRDNSVEGEFPYADIVELPHHRSQTHPHISAHDRAAQFAPFAALTGHGKRIREAERLTQPEIHLDENVKEELDEKLQQILMRRSGENVRLTVFHPDDRKEGGSYEQICARIVRVDPVQRQIFLLDGRAVFVDHIIQIEEENSDDRSF